MSGLTFWREDGSVRLDIREPATRFASARSARKDFVNAAVFRLHVFDFHDVLQSVDGASEIYLPDGGIGFVTILARVYGPLTKEGRVAVLAVAALFRMDPRDSENGLLAVDPFESMEASRVYHATDPVSHAFRSLVVYFSLRHRCHGW